MHGKRRFTNRLWIQSFGRSRPEAILPDACFILYILSFPQGEFEPVCIGQSLFCQSLCNGFACSLNFATQDIDMLCNSSSDIFGVSQTLLVLSTGYRYVLFFFFKYPFRILSVLRKRRQQKVVNQPWRKSRLSFISYILVWIKKLCSKKDMIKNM